MRRRPQVAVVRAAALFRIPTIIHNNVVWWSPRDSAKKRIEKNIVNQIKHNDFRS